MPISKTSPRASGTHSARSRVVSLFLIARSMRRGRTCLAEKPISQLHGKGWPRSDAPPRTKVLSQLYDFIFQMAQTFRKGASLSRGQCQLQLLSDNGEFPLCLANPPLNIRQIWGQACLH